LRSCANFPWLITAVAEKACDYRRCEILIFLRDTGDLEALTFEQKTDLLQICGQEGAVNCASVLVDCGPTWLAALSLVDEPDFYYSWSWGMVRFAQQYGFEADAVDFMSDVSDESDCGEDFDTDTDTDTESESESNAAE
jgi:hypothetical protein